MFDPANGSVSADHLVLMTQDQIEAMASVGQLLILPVRESRRSVVRIQGDQHLFPVEVCLTMDKRDCVLALTQYMLPEINFSFSATS